MLATFNLSAENGLSSSLPLTYSPALASTAGRSAEACLSLVPSRSDLKVVVSGTVTQFFHRSVPSHLADASKSSAGGRDQRTDVAAHQSLSFGIWVHSTVVTDREGDIQKTSVGP